MLSIGKLGSAGAAAQYYRADDYYGRDGEAEAPSRWHGRGAAAAGLTGDVRAHDFAKVMDGQVPGGPLLGRIIAGERQHAPGWDLTFSAPKSVSVYEALLTDEHQRQQLREAHRDAVTAALGWAERSVEARVWDPAERKQVPTGDQGAVIATFEHDLSRDQDPQLHTHCVVANMALGDDGQWRSVDSRRLFSDKMLLGSVYRSELASNLRDLGVEIEPTGGRGAFEVAGFDKTLGHAFSTRREAIEARLEATGRSGAKASAEAALATRQRKGKADPDALRERWTRTVSEHDRDLDRDYTAALSDRDRGTTDRLPFEAARDAVLQAAEHLLETESSFAERDLLRQALTFSLGEARSRDVAAAVSHHVRSGELIAARTGKGDWTYTTAESVLAEKDVIALEARGRGVARPLASGRQLDRRLGRDSFTDGQRSAVRDAVLTCSRVVGVQGYAGTGKTTALRAIADLARAGGYEVRGLAPSHQASAELAKGAKIETETVQRFALRETNAAEPSDLRRTVLIVDESSMLSTRMMRDVLRIAEEGRAARVVLVGDTQQLQAVGAGTPFRALQDAGMATARMDEIVRQRSSEQKASVEAAITGSAREALERLDGVLIETKRSDLAEQAARSFLWRGQRQREETGVIVPTNALRREANAFIRAGLRAEGTLTGEETALAILSPLHLSKAERERAESYAPDQVVTFARDYKRLGIEKGDRYLVAGVDRDACTVSLATADRRIEWAPARLGAVGAQVFELAELQIAKGDDLRFTQNDPEGRFVNGGRCYYLGKSGPDHLIHDRTSGRLFELAPGDPALATLDHDYAHTTHAFQGRTVDQAVIVMDSLSRRLTTQESLYVGLSRARDDVTFITDDRAELVRTLERAGNAKLSAIEVAGMAARGADAKAAADRSDAFRRRFEKEDDERKDDGRSSGSTAGRDRDGKTGRSLDSILKASRKGGKLQEKASRAEERDGSRSSGYDFER
ncbi:MobF family relaxase [Parvularcula dongshanensis]|uniref:Conjugative relaxase-like TrwC/TraI family protein n=1 Tax=Parvularcula dongshanensis TaxID=1173995 RepID=A0A840I705_9PROT|nr:MobF family relaxase [Parvularcula dongshanensis]MBB4659954.1 conjugative relaxase-like TrwC/TraI family protein [Parvularcula dongshanensis]